MIDPNHECYSRKLCNNTLFYKTKSLKFFSLRILKILLTSVKGHPIDRRRRLSEVEWQNTREVSVLHWPTAVHVANGETCSNGSRRMHGLFSGVVCVQSEFSRPRADVYLRSLYCPARIMRRQVHEGDNLRAPTARRACLIQCTMILFGQSTPLSDPTRLKR